MQMERMQGERSMIANIQGLHAGGVNQKPTIPVEWLVGDWNRPDEGPCDSCCGTKIYTLSPLGENGFVITARGQTLGRYSRQGGTDTFQAVISGGVTQTMTVHDENNMSMVWLSTISSISSLFKLSCNMRQSINLLSLLGMWHS